MYFRIPTEYFMWNKNVGLDFTVEEEMKKSTRVFSDIWDAHEAQLLHLNERLQRQTNETCTIKPGACIKKVNRVNFVFTLNWNAEYGGDEK